MRLHDLNESPTNDAAMAKQAHAATMMITRGIYGGITAQHFVELAGHGDFLIWSAKSLGLTDIDPRLSNFCVMLGPKNPNALGLSGAVFRYEPSLFGQYNRCVVVYGLKANWLLAPNQAAKDLVNSTSFIKVMAHEFIHVLDSLRASKIIDRQTSHPDSDENKRKYYNDPAEFNAYYHDIVDMLTDIANAGDDAKDYADLHGFTGNFKTDLGFMLGRDIYTRSFMKWLLAPRHRALLRRIYKMHQHVIQLLNK
jgi:hypothetical protein